MKPEEAAYILDPETSREALRPYLYDPERRIKVVEEACRVAVAALRPVSREQVEKVWSPCNFCAGAKYITGGVTAVYPVSETRQQETIAEGDFDFCPVCGRPLTDEAVQMVMERLEALKDGKDD